MPPTLTTNMVSEESSEMCNKDFKKFELNHARKTSPTEQLTDVFNRQMDRSDPVMLKFFVKLRLKRKKQEKSETVPAEVISMCRPLDDSIIIL